jgi:hypothetical protein
MFHVATAALGCRVERSSTPAPVSPPSIVILSEVVVRKVDDNVVEGPLPSVRMIVPIQKGSKGTLIWQQSPQSLVTSLNPLARLNRDEVSER